MNYVRIYKTLILNRLDNPTPEGYSEKHHIVPRSLGGGDDSDNIISLTPSDHFMAHLLLAKIHGGKMVQALFFMSHEKTTSAVGVRVTRHTYEWARKRYMENLPEHIANVGDRLANNKVRKAAFDKWHKDNRGSYGASVSARYKDPVYLKRWMESQKDAWTDERKASKKSQMKELWKDDLYISKRKVAHLKAVTSPEFKTKISKAGKRVWADPEYRARAIATRRATGKKPQFIEKMTKINREILSRPETLAKISKKSKDLWATPGYKERHVKVLQGIARGKQPIVDWVHDDGRSISRKRWEMSEQFGGAAGMWGAVIRGKRKSTRGWRLA